MIGNWQKQNMQKCYLSSWVPKDLYGKDIFFLGSKKTDSKGQVSVPYMNTFQYEVNWTLYECKFGFYGCSENDWTLLDSRHTLIAFVRKDKKRKKVDLELDEDLGLWP